MLTRSGTRAPHATLIYASQSHSPAPSTAANRSPRLPLPLSFTLHIRDTHRNTHVVILSESLIAFTDYQSKKTYHFIDLELTAAASIPWLQVNAQKKVAASHIYLYYQKLDSIWSLGTQITDPRLPMTLLGER